MSDDTLHEDRKVRIIVEPASSAEEVAAFIAAVRYLDRRGAPSDASGERRPEGSRWAKAGRREAISGLGENTPNR